MRSRIAPVLLVFLVGVGASAAMAETPAPAESDASLQTDQAVGSHLPPRVRGLLVREMVALQTAMNAVLDALLRGDDTTVATQAQSIRDSFILKQEMTPEDRKDLLASVPEEFVTRDRAFHALGGRLAEAADRADRDGQLRLYAELVTACTECHAVHARDRFPHFAD